MKSKLQYLSYRNIFKLFFVVQLTISLSLFSIQEAEAKDIVIKMSTLAPNGSPWHELLLEMAEQWKEASDGKVTLRIYPGGVAGSEGDIIRKMRIGQLHAAAVSVGGLSRIDPAVSVLAIPMAINSWDKLDKVRAAFSTRLENLFEEKGFIILNWGDAGWVRFFGPSSDPSIEAAQKAKMFATAGDDHSIELWKKAGFNAIPLAETDILPSLQTGMINAYNSTALLAFASQWFAFTPYMIDLPWAPLVGATIVSKRTWDKVQEDFKPQLKQIAIEVGSKLQVEIRQMEEDAIVEMKKRGLKVIVPSKTQANLWKKIMENAYPQIRGTVIPEDWFDEALKIVNQNEK